MRFRVTRCVLRPGGGQWIAVLPRKNNGATASGRVTCSVAGITKNTCRVASPFRAATGHPGTEPAGRRALDALSVVDTTRAPDAGGWFFFSTTATGILPRRQFCLLPCWRRGFSQRVSPCEMTPIAFSNQQVTEISALAQPLPPHLRAAYLQRLAVLLSGRDFGDGDVHRAAVQARRELLLKV
jgi:hypothetical protein